jgi:hypothetical protein
LLTKPRTGANRVKTTLARVRCFAPGTDPRKGADSQEPALSVHSDMTERSGPINLTKAYPDAKDELLRGRVQAINVWRPLKTIQRDPLTVIDARSIDVDEDVLEMELKFPGASSILGKMKHNDKHKWYYMHLQQTDEPLVFIQWDSRGERGGKIVPHTAFVDPRYADCEARASIEIKMWVFYDPED